MLRDFTHGFKYFFYFEGKQWGFPESILAHTNPVSVYLGSENLSKVVLPVVISDSYSLREGKER